MPATPARQASPTLPRAIVLTCSNITQVTIYNCRIITVAAARRPNRQDPGAPSRVGAFVCVLALYLAFAGALIALGYGLWPALAAAATACVVAGEVARRVITAGTAPADPAAPPAPGPGLAELLTDISRILDRGAGQDRPGDGRREA